MSTDFGQLRSLLNGEVSKERWEQLAAMLSGLREAPSRHLLEHDWRAYIDAHIERFPDELRVAPDAWFDPIDMTLLRLARDPRTVFVRKLHQGATRTRATWPSARGIVVPDALPDPARITRIDLMGQTALSLHKPPGASFFAAGCSDGSWGIWDEQTSRPIAAGDVDGTSAARIRQIAVNAKGDRLALGVQTSGQWIDRDFIMIDPGSGDVLQEASYRFDRAFRWSPDGEHLITHSVNHTRITDRDGQMLCEHQWRNRGGMRYSLTDHDIYALLDNDLLSSPVGSAHETTSPLDEQLYTRTPSYQWAEDGFVCAPQHGLFSMTTPSLREENILLCDLQNPEDVRMTFSMASGWPQIVLHHISWGEQAKRIALGLVHVGARTMTFCVYDADARAFICAHEADLTGYYSPDARSIFIRDDTALVVNDGNSLTILDF